MCMRARTHARRAGSRGVWRVRACPHQPLMRKRFRKKGWLRAAKHVLRVHPFRPFHHLMRMHLPPRTLDQCGARAHGCPRCSCAQPAQAPPPPGLTLAGTRSFPRGNPGREHSKRERARAHRQASRPRARGARASLTSSDIVRRGGRAPRKKARIAHAGEEGVHSPPTVFQLPGAGHFFTQSKKNKKAKSTNLTRESSYHRLSPGKNLKSTVQCEAEVTARWASGRCSWPRWKTSKTARRRSSGIASGSAAAEPSRARYVARKAPMHPIAQRSQNRA